MSAKLCTNPRCSRRSPCGKHEKGIIEVITLPGRADGKATIGNTHITLASLLLDYRTSGVELVRERAPWLDELQLRTIVQLASDIWGPA